MFPWTDADPADAAAVLAATYVAARREKRALSADDFHAYGRGAAEWAGRHLGAASPYAQKALGWATDPANAPLAGAALGAGLGGLGGGVLGMTSRRKKSPWATALSGALAGGAVGLGAGALSQAGNTRPPVPGALDAALARKELGDYAGSGVLGQLTSDNPPGVLDPPSAILGRGVNRLATGRPAAPLPEGTDAMQNFADDAGVRKVTTGLGLAGGVVADRALLRGERADRFQFGADKLLADKTTPEHVTARLKSLQTAATTDRGAPDRTLADLRKDMAMLGRPAPGAAEGAWSPGEAFATRPGERVPWFADAQRRRIYDGDRAAVDDQGAPRWSSIPGRSDVRAQLADEEAAILRARGSLGLEEANKQRFAKIRGPAGRAGTILGGALAGYAAPAATNFLAKALGFGQQPVNLDAGAAQ